MKVRSLSRVRLFATPWTVASQAPPSMGFSRQECWSGLPFPSPGDLPDPGIEPESPALQADALPSEPPGKPVAINKSSTKFKPFTNFSFQIISFLHHSVLFNPLSSTLLFPNIFLCMFQSSYSLFCCFLIGASLVALVAQIVKNLPAVQETWV